MSAPSAHGLLPSFYSCSLLYVMLPNTHLDTIQSVYMYTDKLHLLSITWHFTSNFTLYEYQYQYECWNTYWADILAYQHKYVHWTATKTAYPLYPRCFIILVSGNVWELSATKLCPQWALGLDWGWNISSEFKTLKWLLQGNISVFSWDSQDFSQ